MAHDDLIAARRAFASGSAASWPLWLVCAPDAYDVFACTWAWFRVVDDVVDAPDRERVAVEAFLADQRLLLTGGRRPGAPLERGLLRALSHERLGPAVRRASELMMEALAFDAARGQAALPRATLEAQIGRIGDAYALALWACAGGPGDAPPGARALARAATAAHHVRDLGEDARLGYCNVPAEDARRPLTDWLAERVEEVDARFAAGLAEASAWPWRPRLVFAALAWRYRRGLRPWAARAAGAPALLPAEVSA